jgi:hypothetical protein
MTWWTLPRKRPTTRLAVRLRVMRAPLAGAFEPPLKYPLKQMSRSANPATIKSDSPPLLCTLPPFSGCETGRRLAPEPWAPKPYHAALPHQPMTAEPPFALACPRGFAGGLWLSPQLGCFRRPQKLGQSSLLSGGTRLFTPPLVSYPRTTLLVLTDFRAFQATRSRSSASSTG